MLLDGRVALITGASSGIGREVARTFAAEGARIAAFDLARDAGEELVGELAAGGAASPLFVCGDVRDAHQVDAVVQDVVDRCGRLDVVVNCAGVREIDDVYELDPAEWANVIAINLSGVFYCCQAAAKRMRHTGGGSIINIASVAGLIGFTQRPAYTAAKHGVVGLTKTLARDLAPAGIRTNAICPGLIRTPLTERYFDDAAFREGLETVIPQGRHGEVREIAQAALFLASDMSSYVNGVALPVDGGWLAEKSFVSGNAGAEAFNRQHQTGATGV